MTTNVHELIDYTAEALDFCYNAGPHAAAMYVMYSGFNEITQEAAYAILYGEQDEEAIAHAYNIINKELSDILDRLLCEAEVETFL